MNQLPLCDNHPDRIAPVRSTDKASICHSCQKNICKECTFENVWIDQTVLPSVDRLARSSIRYYCPSCYIRVRGSKKYSKSTSIRVSFFIFLGISFAGVIVDTIQGYGPLMFTVLFVAIGLITSFGALIILLTIKDGEYTRAKYLRYRLTD
jgi:hypothetical protein